MKTGIFWALAGCRISSINSSHLKIGAWFVIHPGFRKTKFRCYCFTTSFLRTELHDLGIFVLPLPQVSLGFAEWRWGSLRVESRVESWIHGGSMYGRFRLHYTMNLINGISWFPL